MGSIIFVHGTGVRGSSCQKGFELVRRKISKHVPGWTAIQCPWGDKYGVKLNLQGRSIPDYPQKSAEQNEVMRWWRLYQDPFCELRELAAIEIDHIWVAPGKELAWQQLDLGIRSFKPSAMLSELLAEADLDPYWGTAVDRVLGSDEYEEAVERSGPYPGHLRRMFVCSVFAMATALASEVGRAAVLGRERDEIVALAVKEMGGDDLGVRDLGKATLGAMKTVVNIFGTGVLTTGALTGAFSRGRISDKSFPAGGDILLYQARGEAIRDFIKSTILSSPPPIYLLAHSLGGIACVDLLALENLPVEGLITAGSQAPLLYEMNALVSLEGGVPLPVFFPKRWLNFYDPNDLLSYAGGNVFPNRVKDVPIFSRQPFPQSHSSYWREHALWQEINLFLNGPR